MCINAGCGIEKNGIDDFICKAEIETRDVDNKYMDPKRESGGWGGRNWELGIAINTLLVLYKIDN